MTKFLILLLCSVPASVTGTEVKAAASDEKPKIMVVDFELRDVSPIPNVQPELERTALVGSVINATLAEHGYVLISACPALVESSEQGMGYLFDRPEVAGQLGRQCGADYVLMGQTWKPSFLFVFPQVQVVDTRQRLSREALVVVSRSVQLEAATHDTNVTEAAARKLALQIIEKLDSLRSP
jgi:hypothetical protein